MFILHATGAPVKPSPSYRLATRLCGGAVTLSTPFCKRGVATMVARIALLDKEVASVEILWEEDGHKPTVVDRISREGDDPAWVDGPSDASSSEKEKSY